MAKSHTRTHTHTKKLAYGTDTHARTRTRTRACTHTHTRTHARAHTHTRTHAHVYAHAQTRTRTHTHIGEVEFIQLAPYEEVGASTDRQRAHTTTQHPPHNHAKQRLTDMQFKFVHTPSMYPRVKGSESRKHHALLVLLFGKKKRGWGGKGQHHTLLNAPCRGLAHSPGKFLVKDLLLQPGQLAVLVEGLPNGIEGTDGICIKRSSRVCKKHFEKLCNWCFRVHAQKKHCPRCFVVGEQRNDGLLFVERQLWLPVHTIERTRRAGVSDEGDEGCQGLASQPHTPHPPPHTHTYTHLHTPVQMCCAHLETEAPTSHREEAARPLMQCRAQS